MYYETPRCDVKVGGERTWLRRSRRDGTTYSIPIVIGGERCPNDATTSIRKNGRNRHRCTAHAKM